MLRCLLCNILNFEYHGYWQVDDSYKEIYNQYFSLNNYTGVRFTLITQMH